MPVFEQHLAVMARGVRAFLNLEAGITRGGAAPVPAQADQNQQLEEARQLLVSKDQELAELRAHQNQQIE